MFKTISVESFVSLAREYPVLDVRSPGEYHKGHIPGAHSFPLFSDAERAEVGTIYKQIGQKQAVERGLELVQPKMKEMYEEGMELVKDGKILVHCWRGGKRSQSVANFLSISGNEIYVLEKGYKQFRTWVLTRFNPDLKIRIIGGFTGTGKTDILGRLRRPGIQTLDLEGLANHRGSTFGGIGMGDDVTQSQFENELAWRVDTLDHNKVIWAEDESRGIGQIILPQEFWKSMQKAQVFFVDLPREVRVQRLIQDYGNLPQNALREAILRITKRLGGKRTREVIQHLDAGNAEDVVNILLDYYDKYYLHGLQQRDPENVIRLEFETFDLDQIASALLAQR